MGLDFGDLLNILPEGAAAQAAGQGANNIIDSYTKRQMDLENMNQAIIKNDMDRKIQEMTLPTKIMTENLQNAQKLNLMEPEPTDEDFQEVADKIFPGVDLKALNEAQLATLNAQATALAKSKLPELNPWDPSEWMRSRGKDAVSDQQREWDLESKKLEVSLQKESLKQKAALERFIENWKNKKEEGVKTRDAAKERTIITSKTSRDNKVLGESQQNLRQSSREAKKQLKQLKDQFGKLSYYPPSARQAIVQGFRAIEASGDQQTINQARAAFSNVLAAEGVLAPSNAQVSDSLNPFNSKGPKAVAEPRGPRKNIGGKLLEKREDGRWYEVR